ncbi:hypothetical protein D3C80_1907540 [compost metagenome]
MNAQTIIPAITLGDRRADEAGFEIQDERTMAQVDQGVDDPIVDIDLVDRASSDHFKYVVSAKVKDTDYDEIVSKLKSKGAMVDEAQQ